ncbi:MAG: MFS transporter [Clostridia bacterium]|nr:MFS transporter [Clostridia bacterium]
MNSQVSVKDQYRTSRIMYIIEAMVENFISILTAGAYLATLTRAIGISDSMTAVLSALTSLSGLFQIFTILVAHKTPVKGWVIPLQILAHLMLCGLYLIPLFGLGRHASILFLLLILGANGIKSFKSSVKINWFMSMVEPKNRGSYSGILTAVSVVSSLFFSLGASYVFDSFIAAGNERGAFAVISVTILVLIVLDAIPLFISKEKPTDMRRITSPLSSVKELMANRSFRTLLIISTVQAAATGIAPPFLSTYQINELGFSLSFIALTDIIVNAVWVCALLGFGHLSRRLPYERIMHLSVIIQALTFGALIFVVPANGRILFTLYRCLSMVCGSASAVSLNNLVFDLVPETQRTSALAVRTVFTGTISFVVTISVTPLFESLQAKRITLLGTELYAQQFLAICTFSIILIVNILWLIYGRRMRVEH